MSERYLRLFSLPQNIGQFGSPVLISAGALLKDNSTGKVLVQLKFRNISEKSIKSVKIKVNAYDTAGCELKGIDAFSYLDLALGRDKEFGNQTPIVLPDKTTRAFSVEILSVAFMDGTAYIPSIHIAADTLDSDTLETVHLLDDERKEQKEKQLAIKKEKHLRLHHISHLPLIISALSILLSVLYIIPITYNDYMQNGQGFTAGMIFLKNMWFFWKITPLVSLIVPCLSILCYRKAEDKPLHIIIAVGITGVFLIIQIVQTLVGNDIIPWDYYNKHFFSFFYKNIDGCGLSFLFISSCNVITLLHFLTNFLFVVKNIIGFVALYLQVENANN